MAMHGRQVRIASTDDGVVAVQRDVVIDRERGIAAEVEKVVVAVDLGDGNIAVAEQQRVKGVQLLDPPRSQRPALTYTPTYSSTPAYSPGPPRPSTSPEENPWWVWLIVCILCILFFPVFLVIGCLYFCCILFCGAGKD